MKYQQYNDAIYQMRQEILKDIREYASRLMQKSNGVLITNASAPIVTFEIDEKVTNALVKEVIFNKSAVVEFTLVDVFDHSIYVSPSGDNIYLEGLNDILDIVENMSAPK